MGLLDDFLEAYQAFARARVMEERYEAACEGVDGCLQRIARWEYPQAVRRWARFALDRGRPRDSLRIWALSDLHFDQHGSPEWCKSLSSSFFRDDVLVIAGNIADSLKHLRFGLTVLKSKFRRVFFSPGGRDLWVRNFTFGDAIKGRTHDNERKEFADSIAKLLAVLQACDELGVDTAPAEVAEGVFVAPLLSWSSREFVTREMRKRLLGEADTEADNVASGDKWAVWPFQCGADDAWRFLLRMNEPALRATLHALSMYTGFGGQQPLVLTLSHFLPRSDLPFDTTVPGICDTVGVGALDEQLRT